MPGLIQKEKGCGSHRLPRPLCLCYEIKIGEPHGDSPTGRSVIIGLGKIQSYQWFASSKQEVFI